MSKLKLKLKAVWLLLRSDGYVLIHADKPREEEFEAGFIFSGLDAEQIIMFCDTLADELDGELQHEMDCRVSENLGQGMINFINQN